MRAAGLVVVALAAAGGACTGSEVVRVGPKRPSRPADCEVAVYFSPPPFPVTDVATARAQCHVLSGRDECIAELRRDACRLGADTMYGIEEAKRVDYMFVSATLAVQETSVTVTRRPIPPPPAPAPPAGDAAADCEPICSPGFACVSGQCIPQCNPPCEAGEVCSRKRICESAAGAAPPPTGARLGRPPNAPPPASGPAGAASWPPSGPAPPPSEPQVIKRRGRRPSDPAPFAGE
jgi:hypothetical protein